MVIPGATVPGVTHRVVDAGGLPLHIAEAGDGPLVILLHGFPESWYSWRHQLTALARAGFHAVAPDQRGYAATGAPPGAAGADQYTIVHLTGDVLALMDALGEQQAVVAGHDWGAPVAWHTALFRPDRIRGVIGLSVPYLPRGSAQPIPAMRAAFGDGFYMVWFQEPGRAETGLERDLSTTFRRILSSASGNGTEGPGRARPPVVPPGGEFLDICPEPGRLPAWLTDADIAAFAAQYRDSGFTGPVYWYRNLDRNWELTRPWHHAPVLVPALYLTGEQDLVLAFSGGRQSLGLLAGAAPRLREPVVLPGCGHWTQQERPAEVSESMISFLRELD
jgi:pimeloyl-ACP methyl ester carboxylesterase